MAKKRKTTKKRRAPRRNPRKSSRSRAITRARSTFAGLNVKQALKEMIPIQIGMFATKWVAKRFGPAALEGDPATWDWSSYLKGAAGAVGVAFIAQLIKPGMGQKVLTGGLNLIAYKLIQNKFVADSSWASEQFGAEEDDYYPDEYMGAYQPGDVETNSAGTPYLLGEDYQWQQLPEESMMGTLEPVGPLGGAVQPVGPLGGNALDEAYAKALLDA